MCVSVCACLCVCVNVYVCDINSHLDPIYVTAIALASQIAQFIRKSALEASQKLAEVSGLLLFLFDKRVYFPYQDRGPFGLWEKSAFALSNEKMRSLSLSLSIYLTQHYHFLLFKLLSFLSLSLSLSFTFSLSLSLPPSLSLSHDSP